MTTAIDAATAGGTAAATTGKTSSAPDEEQTAYARIREIGFRAFVEEMRAEKLEEMREEILARMGFSEEDLAEMPAEQRAAIEQAISDEIRRRLAAQSEINADPAAQRPGGKDDSLLDAAAVLVTPGPSGAAQGLLLALQETEPEAMRFGAGQETETRQE